MLGINLHNLKLNFPRSVFNCHSLLLVPLCLPPTPNWFFMNEILARFSLRRRPENRRGEKSRLKADDGS